jgi:hypothetical protein
MGHRSASAAEWWAALQAGARAVSADKSFGLLGSERLGPAPVACCTSAGRAADLHGMDRERNGFIIKRGTASNSRRQVPATAPRRVRGCTATR